MESILVAVGGMFGALARYHSTEFIKEKIDINFPLSTLIINIFGAFLLGLLFGIDPSPNTYLLFADGFLGAFTTFSTFIYEGKTILEKGHSAEAITYFAVSLIGGIIVFIIGSMITNALI